MAEQSEHGHQEVTQFLEADLRTVLDVARDRMSFQMGLIGRLDTKVASLFGFGSAIAAVAGAFLAFRSHELTGVVEVLLGIGLGTYALMLITSLIAILPRDFNYGPDLWDIWSRLGMDSTATLVHRVAYSLTAAQDYIEAKINFKERSATVLVVLLGMESILLVSATSISAIP